MFIWAFVSAHFGMEYFGFSEYKFYKRATESRHGECIDIVSGGIVTILGSLQKVENDAVLLTDQRITDTVQGQVLAQIQPLVLHPGCRRSRNPGYLKIRR